MITHETFNDKSHRLTFHGESGRLVIQGPIAGHEELAFLVLEGIEKCYVGTTDFWEGALPEIFEITTEFPLKSEESRDFQFMKKKADVVNESVYRVILASRTERFEGRKK